MYLFGDSVRCYWSSCEDYFMAYFTIKYLLFSHDQCITIRNVTAYSVTLVYTYIMQ